MSAEVLLRLDVLIHTLPILVADANKAVGGLSTDRTVAELREARAAVTDLIQVAKRAESRLTYINIQSGKAIDAALVVDLRAALARIGGEAV